MATMEYVVKYCPPREGNTEYQLGSTCGIRLNIALCLYLSLALTSGTPSDKGLYLTVYPSSCPHTDTDCSSQSVGLAGMSLTSGNSLTPEFNMDNQQKHFHTHCLSRIQKVSGQPASRDPDVTYFSQIFPSSLRTIVDNESSDNYWVLSFTVDVILDCHSVAVIIDCLSVVVILYCYPTLSFSGSYPRMSFNFWYPRLSCSGCYPTSV